MEDAAVSVPLSICSSQSVSKLIVGSKAFFWVSSFAASKKSNRKKYLRLTLH